MTPEQEMVADQLKTIAAVARSARETLPLIEAMPLDGAAFAAMTPFQRMAATAMLKQFEQIEGLLSGLFRAVLRLLGVRLKGLYAQDIGNRMVELAILDDAERWVAVVQAAQRARPRVSARLVGSIRPVCSGPRCMDLPVRCRPASRTGHCRATLLEPCDD